MRANDKGRPRDAAGLEKDIDETRDDVRETLEALEHKLSPGQLVDYAVELARRHGGDYARSVSKAARQNPVATLLTAMGLTWLLTAAQEQEPQGSRDQPAAGADARAAAEAAPPLQGASTRRRSGLERFIHEQPLVIGAVGVAVGAIVGTVLKRSNGSADDLARFIEEEEQAAREPTASADAAAADAAAATGTGAAPGEEGPRPPEGEADANASSANGGRRAGEA